MIGVVILGYLPFLTMAPLIVILILALVISCVHVTPFLLKSFLMMMFFSLLTINH